MDVMLSADRWLRMIQFTHISEPAPSRSGSNRQTEKTYQGCTFLVSNHINIKQAPPFKSRHNKCCAYGHNRDKQTVLG